MQSCTKKGKGGEIPDTAEWKQEIFSDSARGQKDDLFYHCQSNIWPLESLFEKEILFLDLNHEWYL